MSGSLQPHQSVAPCLPTGPDEYAAAVVRALGETADVLAPAPEPWVERYLGPILDGRVALSPLPWPRHRDPRNLMLARRIIGQLRAFGPDVVHFLGDSVLWLLLALPWLRRSPLVVTVHDVVYHPGNVQSRRVPIGSVRRFRRAADVLIVHGQGLRDELTATGVRPPGGVRVVAHPILDRHTRLSEAKSDPTPEHGTCGEQRLLFFGRAMAYKGLAVLVEAARQLAVRHPDLRLVVAGAAPEIDRLAPVLQGLPWVELHSGYVPDAAVAHLFRTADAVILPYVEASQSGVAAMAMAFAKPVVASEVGELGELVRETGMGLLVPPGDVPALAAAIERLLELPALRQGCAERSGAGCQGGDVPRRCRCRNARCVCPGHCLPPARLSGSPGRLSGGGSAPRDRLAQPGDRLARHLDSQQSEGGHGDASGKRAAPQDGEDVVREGSVAEQEGGEQYSADGHRDIERELGQLGREAMSAAERRKMISQPTARRGRGRAPHPSRRAVRTG